MVGNRHPCHFKETDLFRAIRGARRAGITAPRVDIAPDGTISISQLTPQEAVEVRQAIAERHAGRRRAPQLGLSTCPAASDTRG
jgi:hypothetical protein